jgi:hypothetical protein
MPDFDDARVERVMSELERDMDHLDENNPKHMAHLMRKMKDVMPPGTTPKELDVAIKRLEAGEDPEKIEADMGDVLGDFFGGPEGEGGPGGGGGYSRDARPVRLLSVQHCAQHPCEGFGSPLAIRL